MSSKLYRERTVRTFSRTGNCPRQVFEFDTEQKAVNCASMKIKVKEIAGEYYMCLWKHLKMSKQNLHYVHLKCWIWLSHLCLCAVKIDFLLLCFMFAFLTILMRSHVMCMMEGILPDVVCTIVQTPNPGFCRLTYFCWRQRKRDGARLFGKSTIISLKLTDDSSASWLIKLTWWSHFDQFWLKSWFLRDQISRSPGDSMGLVSIAEVETTVIFPEAWWKCFCFTRKPGRFEHNFRLSWIHFLVFVGLCSNKCISILNNAFIYIYI